MYFLNNKKRLPVRPDFKVNIQLSSTVVRCLVHCEDDVLGRFDVLIVEIYLLYYSIDIPLGKTIDNWCKLSKTGINIRDCPGGIQVLHRNHFVRPKKMNFFYCGQTIMFYYLRL